MYRPAVVSYLDILGFSRIVAKESAKKINELLEIFHFVGGADEGYSESFVQVHVFSDCIIRLRFLDESWNVRRPVGLLYREVIDLLNIQGQILAQGYLVRGGVTIGKVVAAENRVFGPGLIDAYNLESKCAIYPRILIGPAALKEMETNPLVSNFGDASHDKHYLSKVCTRGGGYWYIDYLKAIYEEYYYPDTYLFLLKSHREIILKIAGVTKLSQKCLWLAHYHNTVIESISEELLEEMGVKRDTLLLNSEDVPDLRSLQTSPEDAGFRIIG